MSNDYFTIEEANLLLPMLEKELVLLQELRNQFQVQFQDLTKLKEVNYNGVVKTSDEVFLLESNLEFLEIQASLHVQNIHATGAKLKGINYGLLDFPAIIKGREVLLCWKQGESEITHYHEKSKGFSGRKLIDDN